MIKWNENEIEAVARQAKTLFSIDMLKKIRAQVRTGKSCRIVGFTDILHEAQKVLPIERQKHTFENNANLILRIKDRIVSTKVQGINLTTGKITQPKTKKIKAPKATKATAPKTKSKDKLLAALRQIEGQLKALNQSIAA